jgi:hypothetical protein
MLDQKARLCSLKFICELASGTATRRGSQSTRAKHDPGFHPPQNEAHEARMIIEPRT